METNEKNVMKLSEKNEKFKDYCTQVQEKLESQQSFSEERKLDSFLGNK